MSTIGVTVATLYQDLWDQAGPDKVFFIYNQTRFEKTERVYL